MPSSNQLQEKRTFGKKPKTKKESIDQLFENMDRIVEMLDASLDDVKIEKMPDLRPTDSWVIKKYFFDYKDITLEINFAIESYNDTHLISITFSDFNPPGEYEGYELIPRNDPVLVGKLFTFINKELMSIMDSEEGQRINEIKFLSKSSESSRVKLYRTFSKMLAKKFEGNVTETTRSDNIAFYIDFSSKKEKMKKSTLKETLDSSLDDVTIIKPYPERHFYKFQYGGAYLTVNFDSGFPDTISINFRDSVTSGYDLHPRDNPGIMFKLFTFISKKLEQILKEKPEVDNIYFTSKVGEPSRTVLYRRFAKMIADKLGWYWHESPAANEEILFDITLIPPRTQESISPNYWKNGGPTRNQNAHTSFDDIDKGEAGMAFAAGFDLNKTTGYTFSKNSKHPIQEAVSILNELSDIVDTIYDCGIDEYSEGDGQTEWYADHHPKSKFIVHEDLP